jgi:hypothetical protein
VVDRCVVRAFGQQALLNHRHVIPPRLLGTGVQLALKLLTNAELAPWPLDASLLAVDLCAQKLLFTIRNYYLPLDASLLAVDLCAQNLLFTIRNYYLPLDASLLAVDLCTQNLLFIYKSHRNYYLRTHRK